MFRPERCPGRAEAPAGDPRRLASTTFAVKYVNVAKANRFGMRVVPNLGRFRWHPSGNLSSMEIRQAADAEFSVEVRKRLQTGMAGSDANRTPAASDAEGAVGLNRLDESLRLLQQLAGAVGEIPPGPSTLRARVGRVLIRAVQRMLFWYTPQIYAFNNLAVSVLSQASDAVARMKAENAVWHKQLEEALLTYESMQRMFSQTRLEMAEIRKRAMESLDAHQVPNLVDEERHKTDALYISFEDCFRGTRADIKNRLRVYLPRLREARIGQPGMPVLDVGCGRGEWLELLREEGLAAKGLDLNRAMVAECREHGLDVAEGDLLLYLHTLPDASLGALTGFHIIEHLPFTVLIALFDETVRLLKPGGMAIFETPNPANLLVGSCTFYYDPTHRNPLPSPALAFMAESRGLRQVEILPLHPASEELHFKDDNTAIASRLNEYFFGPQDYAMIGRKT